jgi:hypothetical protein
MSTIMDFVGSGLGSLLEQNIDLLNDPAASAQMFAIAMDQISSILRKNMLEK